MNEKEEEIYIRGSRSVWAQLFRECILNLGYDSPEFKNWSWVSEREDAIRTLRRICDEFGDNDWPNNLHLMDIIDKHLGRHLEK